MYSNSYINFLVYVKSTLKIYKIIKVLVFQNRINTIISISKNGFPSKQNFCILISLSIQKVVIKLSEHTNLKKLTLASMFAALAFICFSYLRIEIPMGGGMTGKIYIGHTFIILSAFFLGAKYGGLTGAIGLSLADVLAGYAISAPPTFIAKFLLGLTAAIMARQVFKLATITNKKHLYFYSSIAGIIACIINVITEPLIRYAFKVYIMGFPEPIAYLSAINCAISMAISAIPSIILASFLYVTFYTILVKSHSATASKKLSH